MSEQVEQQRALARELHGDAERPEAAECGQCNATAAAVLASDWLARMLDEARTEGHPHVCDYDEGLRDGRAEAARGGGSVGEL